MPTFKLDRCSVELLIEPLVGPLATADRRAAWRLYLALLTRPALRLGTLEADAVSELLASIEEILAAWPSADLEHPQPRHLGPALGTIVEWVLLPSLVQGGQVTAWQAVKSFCQALRQELAASYSFQDPSLNPPADLLEAWRRAESP